MVLLPITDVGSEKPSSSIPQKRPSPNSSAHQLSTKRINTSQSRSFISKNEPKLESTREKEDNEGKIDDENTEAHDTIAEASSIPVDEKSKVGSNASCSHAKEIDKNQHVGERSEASKNSNSIRNLAIKVKTMSPNLNLTSDKFMEDFNTKWLASDGKNSCQKFNHDSVKLFSDPFKLCVISDFLENSSFVQEIVDEMCQMEWHRKQMDLYEFHQTSDLANLSSNAKPALKSFYNMLLNNMLPWMKEITGLPLTRISASCSMYNYGDYLLVHDDLLSDRQIAFVFYLSPWCTEWSEKMGGALELFERDSFTGQPKYPIVQKFSPRNNQFVFFRVCKESFHQVGEVTNLVYPRLTINGWFHGPVLTEHEKHTNTDSIDPIDIDLEYLPAGSDELDLNEWINACYLRKRVKNGIQQHIEEKSEASLEMFLISEFFDLLVSEFKDNTGLNWVLEGPANQRKYERLHFTPQTTGPLKDLYTLFTSETMFSLLHEYTELDFHGMNARNPTCSVQLCRFTQGCYTLLGDSSTFNDSALDVILFFSVRDGVGKITYLSPSQGVNEYSTTAETDATASSMDVSGIDANDMSSSSATMKNIPSLSKPSRRVVQQSQANSEQCKHPSGSSNIAKTVETSNDDEEGEVEEASVEDLSISNDSNGAKIRKNVAANNLACTTNKIVVQATVHEINDSDNYDVESINSEVASEDNVSDELAQEDALLTIHPKNNSLNLVYRLNGQTKFVKYISKNSLKPDEYVYLLFATYKE